ncbi:hypothetical protein [Antarcticirhabdus aurantiaca]|uniref:Uncharacterized protein n=1 Tax=Antarcticirhabdus aurantiaca TaxID=2606717 RepID=A0ACD4NW10_9HYPH|nr:hypothetical protein [Antarcticirhabdus aurantiaca]WAJ31210.1 hypothetical protein OXU80_13830 [Jeongeuplla avenae]
MGCPTTARRRPDHVQTIGFGELLDTYWIEDRTLFALFEADELVTLGFDLYHCDDPERCQHGVEYRLDVSVPRGHIQILDGSVERFRTEFCADILTAEIQQGDLHLLADCTFYPSRTNDIVGIVLSSGVARIEEHAPVPVTLPTAT